MTKMHRRVCLALGAWILLAGIEAGGQTPVAPAVPPAAAGEQEFAPTLPYEERITRDGRVQRMT